MWLINTETGDLENVPVPIRGSYAILSHTWEDEEISFQLYRNSRSLAMDSKGYAKVAKTLELARSWDLMYAWVDTCCIDKSSSAELSEAINSMYSWYSNAAVCFAFLSDFDPRHLPPGRVARSHGSCRWFRRGWTFQELIAPAEVEFYDAEWNYIGNKTDTMISRAINQVTRIPIALLNQTNSVRSFSIAQRMSWVADRETTRIEDVAYSLLGLFHVNMPLLYGEGRKAFVRLQEEICKQSNDLSIFAWKARCDDEFADSPRYRDIFAHSPSEYHDCHNLILSRKKFFEGEIRITSRGIGMRPDNIPTYGTASTPRPHTAVHFLIILTRFMSLVRLS
ncbi:heterokaryon incompatibility protein-domain-containing protein [Xylariaceae sp. FL1272]|nr:heterokaryon incompatibility protein-domain-containing protein [Xylariaceae sp. FL1272]